MKTKSLNINYVLTFLFFVLLPFNSKAFEYRISFTGSGESTSVDSVVVQNLYKSTQVTVPAGSLLRLYDFETSTDFMTQAYVDASISPNPIMDKGTFTFFVKNDGKVLVSVYCADGKKVAGVEKELMKGVNSFQLSLPRGVFLVTAEGNGFSYSVKAIRLATINYVPTISFNSFFPQAELRKIQSPQVNFQYSPGDQLLYKGYSGNFCTIVTDKPTETKTTDFKFVDCTDADGNHYAVVHIGTQTWMAENLKTTKFRTGKSITNITGYTAWKDATSAAWCVYGNDQKYKNIYGLLYNWYAVIDAKNITPVGWHVPELSEWETLKNYLISNGFNYDGSVVDNKIGKSLAANILWAESTIEGSPGKDPHLNNASGFSALPGGYRYVTGPGAYFNYLTKFVFWWTKTEYNSETVYFKLLGYDTIDLWESAYGGKSQGFYVRCLKD